MRTYLKSTGRVIRQSFGRFMAMVAIILMGVLLFVGIKAIGPQLEYNALKTIQMTETPQLQLVGTAGVTPENHEQLAPLFTEMPTGQLSYSLPYWEPSKQQVLLVNSANDLTDNQVRIDANLADSYPIGSTLTLDLPELKNKSYQVIGYQQSPLYLDRQERGVTTVGDGQVDGFVEIATTQFDLPAYTTLQWRFPKVAQWSTLTAYQQFVQQEAERVEKQLTHLAHARREELQQSAQESLAPAQSEYQSNYEVWSSAQSALASAQQTLDSQSQELSSQYQAMLAQYGDETVVATQFATPQAQLASVQAELTSQQTELAQNESTLESASMELASAQATIDNLELPTYYLTKWQDFPGMSEYLSLARRIDAIANVFPLFFFAIALLITFTSMTRMVEENRKEIGLLKALGYHASEISMKYLIYASVAALVGGGVGATIGSLLLPKVVLDLLATRYQFEAQPMQVQWPIVLGAIFVAWLATVSASVLVLWQQLREKPAQLLIAKAPKAGKRVLLERIKWLWARFNFRQKMTYRNIFRYQSRLWLTVGGIAGCMGLIVAGFGLRYSIPAPLDLQFEQVWRYQAIVTAQSEQMETLQPQLLQQASNLLKAHIETFSVVDRDGVTQEVSVYVLPNDAPWRDFIPLQTEQGQALTTLPASGGVVSRYLGQAGNTLTLKATDGQSYSVAVEQKVLGYVGQQLYMSEQAYQQLTGKASEWTHYLVKFDYPLSELQEQQIATEWLKLDGIQNTSFIQTQLAKKRQAAESLDVVVWIFILLSGALALVVLYNLTVINIAEREREFATLKVLGFYEEEVTWHLVRETIVFTVLGIIAGAGVGRLLTEVILTMASSYQMVFPVLLHWTSYALAAGLTIVFAAVVSIMTHWRLKRIDMIEALKGNE